VESAAARPTPTADAGVDRSHGVPAVNAPGDANRDATIRAAEAERLKR
jgi:hypothetical protein